MTIPPDDRGPGPTLAGPATCPRCGYGNRPRARFCSECGLRLAFFCWSCGNLNRASAIFCQACGLRLTPPAEPETGLEGAFGSAVRRSASVRVGGPVDRGSPGVAPVVGSPDAPASAREDLSGPSVDGPAMVGDGAAETSELAMPAPELDEERRVVTVLFADIVGFTTLSEQLDPEDARELVATTHGKLVEAVALYGGTVDKFIGDAVMALFGAPTAHPDDPIRAVRAALAMQQAMVALDPAGRDGRDLQLQLRIGVNTGEVVAGSRDVGGYREYSVYGDVVNTAARLQTAAEPGGILLGETTARAVQPDFELERTEPLELRGKEQEVRAFRVLGAAHAAPNGRATSGPDPLRVPLVGRIVETRRLRERMQELARGRGQIVSIIGEHGVGKSRLVGELRGHAEELGLRWTEARALSYGQSQSYGMFRETIVELFGIRDGEPDDVADARLREGLRDLDAEVAYPHFAYLLGLPRDPAIEAELRGLSARQIQRRTLAAVRHFFRALANKQPFILVLDDLQWADPSSIALLEDAVSLSDEAPILFCYLFTPDRDAPCWSLKELAGRSYPHRYTELTLAPLGERPARELVCALLDCAETPAHLEDLVLEKAEGNPYFVEEVLRALIDQGALRRVGDRWIAERDIREIHIPETLLATIMARIDGLPEGVRRTLQIAAVIGREFSERVLRRVADGATELDRHLREAQRAGLIHEEAAIPERRYAFTQVLIQDAARRSLLLRRRREIHVQVGWALEEVYADDLEEQYGALARHFSEGEAWERAYRYGRLAGERAAQTYANGEAVTNYTMAMEAAERSAAGADPEVLAELAERRADVRMLVGEYDAAHADLEAAFRHHAAAGEAARRGEEADPEAASREAAHAGAIALKLARLHSLRKEMPEMDNALKLAFAQLPPESPDLSSAWSLKAIARVWHADLEGGAEAARRGLSLARERGSTQHLSEAYQALTYPGLLGVIGVEVREFARQWLELAREQGDPPTLFQALVAHSFIHFWGLWAVRDEYLADTTEALDLARAMGSTALESTARGVRGIGLALAGRWDEAEQELRWAAERPTSVSGLDGVIRLWLYRLLTLRGALDEAEARRPPAQIPGPYNLHGRIVMNSQVTVSRRLAGDEEGSRAALEAAAKALDELGCQHCAALFHSTAAELYAESGDRDAAAPHIARALELGAQFDRQPTILAARRADALLKLRMGDAAGALGELAAAAELARRIGQPYEEGRTVHLLGRAVHARGGIRGAREHLQRALDIFEGLRAEPDAAAVRRTLERLEP